MYEGVDYAFPPWPRAEVLRTEGKRFTCRYFGGSSEKDLTRDEAQGLTDQGIRIVSNWESGAQAALRGYAGGVQDATAALVQARAVGMPIGYPIFFSIDFDTVSDSQRETVTMYLHGCSSVLTEQGYSTGVYGEYEVIEFAWNHPTVQYYWQTYAWSGGKVSAHADIYQYKNSVLIDGADCDLNRAAIIEDLGWFARIDLENGMLITGVLMGKAFTSSGAGWVDQTASRDAVVEPCLGFADSHLSLVAESSLGDEALVRVATFKGGSWTVHDVVSVRADKGRWHVQLEQGVEKVSLGRCDSNEETIVKYGLEFYR